MLAFFPCPCRPNLRGPCQFNGSSLYRHLSDNAGATCGKTGQTAVTHKKQEQAPCVVLTPEMITLTQQALALFELPLQRADHRDAKVAFAEETIEQVKSKLAMLKRSVGLPSLIGFDYNEKVILVHALRLYCMSLLSFPQNAQRTQLIRACLRLAAMFAADNAVEPT